MILKVKFFSFFALLLLIFCFALGRTVFRNIFDIVYNRGVAYSRLEGEEYRFLVSLFDLAMLTGNQDPAFFARGSNLYAVLNQWDIAEDYAKKSLSISKKQDLCYFPQGKDVRNLLFNNPSPSVWLNYIPDSDSPLARWRIFVETDSALHKVRAYREKDGNCLIEVDASLGLDPHENMDKPNGNRLYVDIYHPVSVVPNRKYTISAFVYRANEGIKGWLGIRSKWVGSDLCSNSSVWCRVNFTFITADDQYTELIQLRMSAGKGFIRFYDVTISSDN